MIHYYSSLSSVIFAPLDPPLILKLTKQFHWLHDPLLHLLFFSHSLGLLIFIGISFGFKRKNSQSETVLYSS